MMLCSEHDFLYPGVVVSHLDVDPRDVLLTTADPPADDACELPDPSNLTHQRSPAISLAGVLALLPTGADKAGVKDKVVAQPGLLQFPLTVEVSEDGQVDLLQDVLVGPDFTKGVLPPATDPAPLPCEALEGVRKTNRRDVGVPGEINEAVNLYDSQVVVEVAGVVLGVDLHLQHVELNVGEELAVVVDVPLAQPDPELLRPVLLDAVSRCEEVSAVNETAATDVHIVVLLLLQYGDLPGVLAELSVALSVPQCRVVDPAIDPVSVPLAALAVLAELSLGVETVEGLAEVLGLSSASTASAARGTL